MLQKQACQLWARPRKTRPAVDPNRHCLEPQIDIAANIIKVEIRLTSHVHEAVRTFLTTLIIASWLNLYMGDILRVSKDERLQNKFFIHFLRIIDRAFIFTGQNTVYEAMVWWRVRTQARPTVVGWACR
ncbi:unnamed protein product [Fusarium venenatum]|uniref:Uncharacterized protein n=1 Tax=Fusarium venenatum TaxID=56646 RepID=A0A2L2T6X4_9HYPO|nr:uncharacterized protein FVRRES_12429 [Fusarium venenatum]CEI39738.1 unnamed protein product [Fusarium venenatum]